MVVLYLATLTHRSRLTDINDDVFMFVKDRFFVNEVIDAMVEGQSQRFVDIYVGSYSYGCAWICPSPSSSWPFPYLGSAHRVFNLHVLRSCASIFTRYRLLSLDPPVSVFLSFGFHPLSCSHCFFSSSSSSS